MKWHSGILPALTLFGSASTLVCCALPALFVALGAGATLAGIVSTYPQLVWLSEHKVGLFILAGALLAVSGILRTRARNAPCPVDPAEAKACQKLRRISAGIFWFSAIVYGVGFFFAFMARYFV